MPTTQRVLSGSITKGSTATLTGSVQYYYQGVNSRTFSSYYGSLIPRVGSGDRTKLYKSGHPVSDVLFDDSIILNNTAEDMGGETDLRLEQRVNFDFEKRNFGQPPVTLQGEPYADALDFDPVAYIQDSDEVMWPVNLWNLGDLPSYEYDGVIEPLDIRDEILGYIDGRFEGRAIRGSLVGGSSEKPWGSNPIKSEWAINDAPYRPFLDAPDGMSSESINFAMQAYQDIRNPDDSGFTETDYHDNLYITLILHNTEDIHTALRNLNTGSCNTITNPFEKRANRGFYFGEDGGSIIFGNAYMLGEEG